MKTLSDSLIEVLNPNSADIAAKNGMTLAQFSVAQTVAQAVKSVNNPAAIAILKDKQSALAAFDRVANLPVANETSESRYARVIAAILA